MENSPQAIDTSKFVSVEEYKALQAQVDAFKSVAEEARKAADAKIAAIESERTKEKISAIVHSKVSDAKTASELVVKFVDAKMAPELVEQTLALIPTPKKDNTANFQAGAPADAKADERYAKASAYANSLVRGASI